MIERCPLDKQYGDIVCRNGVLWALTYSEMGPPDSRQWHGICEWPGHKHNNVTHCCDGLQEQPK